MRTHYCLNRTGILNDNFSQLIYSISTAYLQPQENLLTHTLTFQIPTNRLLTYVHTNTDNDNNNI